VAECGHIDRSVQVTVVAVGELDHFSAPLLLATALGR
jgi:hypothetical protein